MVGYSGAFEVVGHTAETKSDKVVDILREIATPAHEAPQKREDSRDALGIN